MRRDTIHANKLIKKIAGSYPTVFRIDEPEYYENQSIYQQWFNYHTGPDRVCGYVLAQHDEMTRLFGRHSGDRSKKKRRHWHLGFDDPNFETITGYKNTLVTVRLVEDCENRPTPGLFRYAIATYPKYPDVPIYTIQALIYLLQHEND